MISFCTLARDTPNLDVLISMVKKNCFCEVEVCIGDNSSKPEFTKLYKELADVYVRIEDRELYLGDTIALQRWLIHIKYYILILMNIQFG